MNPDLRISLVLNEATPAELAELCPWVDKVYRVPVAGEETSFDRALQQIPTDWDYLIGDPRLRPPTDGNGPPFQRFHMELERHVTVRIASGFAEDHTLPFKRPGRVSIRPPQPTGVVRDLIEGLDDRQAGVAVLLAGGSFPPSFWPSKDSWGDILRAVARSHPLVRFFLIGNNRPDNPHLKTQFPPDDAAALLAEGLAITDCRDIDLLGQLAIIESCRLFVSPHTGFAYGALAVGTPWLTISGGRWKEYFFNGVPFYSVLPDPERYPAFDECAAIPVTDVDGSLRIPSMKRQRFVESSHEITEASAMLIERRLDYETCLAQHLERLEAFSREQERLVASRAKLAPASGDGVGG